MKKMMIAVAAVALAGVAAAADCGVCGTTSPCPFGYRLKVMVRTTKAKEAVLSGADTCTPCTECYRAPAIRRFIGVVYGTTSQGVTSNKCSVTTACACNAWEKSNVAIWDYDTQKKVDLDAAGTELLQLDRIADSQDLNNHAKAEMVFTLAPKCNAEATSLTFAGFGLTGIHENQITVGQMSGYCAGQLPSVCGAGTQCGVDSCGSWVWSLCSENVGCKILPTAAYGKWTLVWDSDVASKVGTNLTDTKATTGWGEATPVQFVNALPACTIAK